MLIFFSTIMVLFMILFFSPTKMAIKVEDIPKDAQYYICERQSTTGPNWCIIGDQFGFYGERIGKSVIIEGVNPEFILNESVQIDSPNTYIIYGEITSKFYDKVIDETFPVITSTGFDLMYPIVRGYSLRVFVPKHYLTLLDYRWFSLLSL